MADWKSVGRSQAGLIGALSRRADIVLTVLASASAYRSLLDSGTLRNATYLEANEHPFTPKGSYELNRAYEDADVDLLHCLSPCVPRVALEARPIVVTIHDLIPLAVPLSMPNALKRLEYAGRNRQALQVASAVIVPSQVVAQDIHELFPLVTVDSTVIPEAVDESADRPVVEPTVSAPYLLAMGDTRPHKNLGLLIGALEKLQLTHPDTHLLLAGRQKRDWLKQQYEVFPGAKGMVHFTGPLDDARMRGYYRHAQAFLFPSYCEGFAREPLEAGTFALPVIASNATAISEVMADGVLLVDPHSIDGWVDAIASVLDNEASARDLGGRALQRSGQFRWADTATKTVEVYRAVLRDARVALNRAPLY